MPVGGVCAHAGVQMLWVRGGQRLMSPLIPLFSRTGQCLTEPGTCPIRQSHLACELPGSMSLAPSSVQFCSTRSGLCMHVGNVKSDPHAHMSAEASPQVLPCCF